MQFTPVPLNVFIQANLMLHVRQEIVFAKLFVQLLKLVCVEQPRIVMSELWEAEADQVLTFVPCVCGVAESVCSFPVQGHECARSLVSVGVLASADGTRYLLTLLPPWDGRSGRWRQLV